MRSSFLFVLAAAAGLLVGCAAPTATESATRTPTPPEVEQPETQARAAAQELRRLEAGDTVVQYQYVTPAGYEPGATYPVLLALPPAGGERSDVTAILDAYFREPAQARGWVVVAPLAPKETPEAVYRTPFHLGSETFIPPLLDAVAGEIGIEGDRVHVAGVSTGGAGAFRVATQYPDRIASLLALPGSAREQDREIIGVLGSTPVRMYVGENEDEAEVAATEATVTVLESAGVPVELVVVADDGHVIESVSGSELFDWLDQQRAATAK